MNKDFLQKIACLESINDLIQIGFNEKNALTYTYKLYPQHKSMITHLQHQLTRGIHIHNAIDALLHKSSHITFNLPSIQLKKWLPETISTIKQNHAILQKSLKHIQKSSSLLITTFLLNTALVTFFIPQMNAMFQNFNVSNPTWLNTLSLFTTTIGRYGIPCITGLICLCLICKSPLKKYIQYYVRPMFKFNERIEVLQRMACFLATGVSLKQVTQAIHCSPKAALQQSVTSFKDHILVHHNTDKAFERLIQNPVHTHLVNRSLNNNQLASGLAHTTRLLIQIKHQTIQKYCNLFTVCAHCLTACSLLCGFYITILPMTHLLNTLLTP